MRVYTYIYIQYTPNPPISYSPSSICPILSCPVLSYPQRATPRHATPHRNYATVVLVYSGNAYMAHTHSLTSLHSPHLHLARQDLPPSTRQPRNRNLKKKPISPPPPNRQPASYPTRSDRYTSSPKTPKTKKFKKIQNPPPPPLLQRSSRTSYVAVKYIYIF